MRVLYGVVGEGMGHATRSRVVLEHLLSRGHEVRVVVSGKAHGFLVGCFAGRRGIAIEEIQGLHLDYDGNALDLAETIRRNLERAASRLASNLEVYRKVAEEGFRPDLVVSDFESWAFLYGRVHRIPVVSIDNMQVINRCRHEDDVTGERGMPFRLAKAAVKFKLPGAYHYLVTSFFFPPVRKPRTTLVPPILRPEILAARRERADHVVVYLRAAELEDLAGVLKRMPGRFRVYGMGREGTDGNVELRPFSQTGFIDDLRTARAVVGGGGYSLMGEAVHLRVPLFSVPIAGQYEQEINARYLEKLGYGAWAPRLEPDRLAAFLANSDAHAAALASYRPADNGMVLDLVDELSRRVERGEPPPVRLDAPSVGRYEGEVGIASGEWRVPVIRRADIRDKAEWLRLRESLWPHHDRSDLDREIDQILAAGEREAAFVAGTESGRLCGLIEVSVRERARGCRTRGVGYVEAWFVDPDARERSVGRSLVLAAEDWARSRGCREMASDTTPRYPASRGAHAALGFEEVGITYHFRKDL